MFGSRSQMVFESLMRKIPLLPSPKEIVYGLIQAQINEFSNLNEKAFLIAQVDCVTNIWKKIFSMAHLGPDFNKPLNPKVLADVY